MRQITSALILVLAAGSAAFAQQRTARPGDLPPVPSDLARRTSTARARLQPAVQAWVVQQARVESKRDSPDIDALRATIRQRFAGSLAGLNSGAKGPASALAQDNAVDALAVIVILEMVQDNDQDLNAQMQNAQAMMQAKQQIRALLNELNQQIAQMQGPSEKGAGKSTGSSAPCVTAFCRNLPAKLSAINAATSRLRKPTRLQMPATVNTQQLNTIRSELQNTLDSENDLSDQDSTELQMLMDQRSKLLQTASDIEKSKSDADMAIVGNIKQ